MRDIPYGEANFENIINENGIYVDKTMYIEKLEQGMDRKKTIYLRPRRFGKSLFTSMLTCYYSVDMEKKFENLFKGLYIYDNPTKNKNNYYVLNFDFSGLAIDEKDIVESGKNAFYNVVKDSITRFIDRYDFEITPEGDTASDLLRNALVKLEGLKLNHNVYIIIDEYDNFTNAILKGDAGDFLDLVNRNGYVRSFYEVIKQKLKEGIVERFFATGVMPLTLDNLTSGFNIATNLTTHPEFTSMIGFTHEEVKKIVEEVIPKEDVQKVYEDLEANYDGYRFSLDIEEKTFNSTLVMYYLKNYMQLKKPPRSLLDVNMNTSGDKIKRIVELINPKENYEAVREIILKNKVAGKLNGVVLNEKYDRDDFLTMLFHLGYITLTSENIKSNTVFTVPNYITSTIYSEYIAELLRANEEYKIDTSNMQDAIECLGEYGEITKTVELVKEFLKYASVRDMETFDEMNLKHTFAMILSLTKQYMVYGEFPANHGFADIMVQKTSSSLGKYEVVIELKYISKQNAKEAKINNLIEEAKNQLAKYIEDKRLNQKEYLRKYAIIFVGLEEYIIEEL